MLSPAGGLVAMGGGAGVGRAGLLVVLVGLLVEGGFGAALDIADIIHRYEDDILGHHGGIETRDYQPSPEEDELAHPVLVHGWGSGLDLGQVTGVDVDGNNDPVIFHRGPVTWDGDSFDNDDRLRKRKVIEKETVLVLDQDTGVVKKKWGAGRFYMPHGLTVDDDGNTWVTDVGLHQVMKFIPGDEEPAVVLGEAFVPGSDSRHFCKPTSVAVSGGGIVFVADGYCNSRVVVFDADGRNLNRTITGKWSVVHSLALFEDEDVLCIADREGGRVECVVAGLHSPQLTGQLVVMLDKNSLEDDLGRVFAIAGKGTALLAVTLPGWGQQEAVTKGLTIDMTSKPMIVDKWGVGDLKNPHDVAISRGGDAVYVAERGPNKIRKFEVVVPQEDLF